MNCIDLLDTTDFIDSLGDDSELIKHDFNT